MATTAAASLPVVSFDALWHVGTAEPDGSGLPVTDKPAADTGTVWRLTRPGNLFLDAHALDAEQQAEIAAWGITHNYVSPITAYRIDYFDTCTGDARQFLLTDPTAGADINLGALPSTITEVAALTATSTFPDSTVPTGTVDPVDRLTLAWITAEHPTLDGVWWTTTAHGIIGSHRLSDWSRAQESAPREGK